jgi:predicted DNA-binding transcriptional regulator AlpA
MTNTTDMPLMGTTEMAALLGVSRQRAAVLARREDFPAPVATLAMGTVWDAAAVRSWAATWMPQRDARPRGGRPRKNDPTSPPAR